MSLINKAIVLQKSQVALSEICDLLNEAKETELRDLPSEKTALIIVDMVNGFAKEGALYSPKVEALIADITELSKKCDEMGITKLAFADHHTNASPEFTSYPPHCLSDTIECQIVDEIKDVGNYLLIPKNSTNGFLEPEFQKWLLEHKKIVNFIIVGDCTDICISQLAITLKTWFNRQDKSSRIIVPINAVNTYDLGTHQAELMQIMALYNMIGNGVEIVSKLY